ncbi:MAG: hypothetical protein IT244_06270 [Bacteroidia bacterium]|nr:hypothetical protein [Bacteroidia bacterium]
MVNQDKLSYIARNPTEITTSDARELEELTKKFPFFTLPHVLLSRFYHSQNDYRLEETIHKTALRVNDRAWLYWFLNNTTSADADIHELEVHTQNDAVALAEAQVEAEPPITEPAEFSHSNDWEETASTSLFVPDAVETQDEAAVELLAEANLALTDVPKPEAQDELELTLNSIESMFEPWDEGDLSLSEVEIEEEAVFDEIESFDSLPNNDIEALNESEPDVEEEQLPALMVTPDAELEELETETQEVTEKKTLERNMFAYSGASVYNIEDYYPIDKQETETPDDFFAWLSKPKFTESDSPSVETVQEADKKIALIDKFIESKPTVSRPKSEFFNAYEAAKKSEMLPEALVTETLARVYLDQGNFNGALRIYEKLQLKNPLKSAYFANLIEKIKKENQL